MKILLAILTCIAVLFLNGCSDSDQYLFDASDMKSIEVSAFMTRSLEQEDLRTKQDTINPGDSIIFITSIYPSKSVRLQRYYWNIDGNFFANEFSFKNTVMEPGIHKIEFILIDYYGDTVKDSLTLFVAAPPRLDAEEFFPRQNSQCISYANILNFVWFSQEKDYPWEISYRFTLTKARNQEVLVDTLLSEHRFSYKAGFSPLEKYSWKVEAINELGQVSQEPISADFYTAGYGDNGAISGNVTFESEPPSKTFLFTLLDSSKNVVRSFRDSLYNEAGDFYLGSIPAGRYTLISALDSFPDFKPDTSSVQIKASQIVTGINFSTQDKVSPKIRHESNLTTLDAADTLRFIVTDGGCELKVSRMRVMLEDAPITPIYFRNDTLLVPMPSQENSWTTKFLTVHVQDLAGNKQSSEFQINPSTIFTEVLFD